MTKHPLLLVGACGLVVLSLAWATVLVVTVGTPIGTTPEPIAVMTVPPLPTPTPATTTPSASPLATVPQAVITSPPTPRQTVRPTQRPTPRPTPTPRPPRITPPPSIAVTCANGVDNGGGTGTLCSIAVHTKHTTVRECHGAAGDPTALCKTTTIRGRATSVSACNGTANGGGAVLLCSVTVFGGHGGSVRLCIGSGAGGTLVGMTCTAQGSGGVHVEICNGSGNGGGALIVCSVRRR